jgi:5-methyltetrahydropteroyltriglutamate--homocysteine methyltransferase
MDRGAMTLEDTLYAQSLTDRPVKGMLTGPITMLAWSFYRDDISRKEIADQIARALDAEVLRLEAAGIGMIQVDEPALREIAPLKRREWPEYLQWSVNAFRRSVAGVRDETQIHTHMCYCDYHEIIDAVEAMDADVISLETSRSHGSLIHALEHQPYANGIGLGVYDIHSPVVPETETMLAVIRDSLAVVPADRLWVNPDCGLKTRGETETLAALKRLTEAAALARAELA